MKKRTVLKIFILLLPFSPLYLFSQTHRLREGFIRQISLSGLKNDFDGWCGMKFTTGDNPVTMVQLGRWIIEGNKFTHTVKLIHATTGNDVEGASVTINPSNGKPGDFKYANLPAPVILPPKTSFYLVSSEAGGKDSWYTVGKIVETEAMAHYDAPVCLGHSQASPIIHTDSCWGAVNFIGYCETEGLVNGKVYKTFIQSKSYSFDHALYGVFIPDGLTEIRGILIHQHGCTMEGRGVASAYDIQYQSFAKKWGLAIVGPDLYPGSNASCAKWREPEEGSGPALLEALKEVARLSGHAELTVAPWLLWGHSGGGYWVLAMMKYYPERILGVVAYSPAFDPQWDYPQTALKIPLLIRHAGSGDLNGPGVRCWDTAIHTFDKLRKCNAPVAIAYTPGETHNLSYLRYMSIPFFESVLKQRLPAKTGDSLKDIDHTLYWVGDTLSRQVYKASDYDRDTKHMAVLPDSVAALAWKEYVTSSTVVDQTMPPAPYALEWVDADSSMGLRWQADADIESGIHHFNIYKNNQLTGQFPDKNEGYQTFDTNGDDPVPVLLPDMQYFFNKNEMKRGDVYAVSTVNHFNLESQRTEINGRK
jgi:pimeloyl-ACP methyl ester carboxylesterase